MLKRSNLIHHKSASQSHGILNFFYCPVLPVIDLLPEAEAVPSALFAVNVEVEKAFKTKGGCTTLQDQRP